jgi:hypothetical protein
MALMHATGSYSIVLYPEYNLDKHVTYQNVSFITNYAREILQNINSIKITNLYEILDCAQINKIVKLWNGRKSKIIYDILFSNTTLSSSFVFGKLSQARTAIIKSEQLLKNARSQTESHKNSLCYDAMTSLNLALSALYTLLFLLLKRRSPSDMKLTLGQFENELRKFDTLLEMELSYVIKIRNKAIHPYSMVGIEDVTISIDDAFKSLNRVRLFYDMMLSRIEEGTWRSKDGKPVLSPEYIKLLE